jgi:hypothetical protein
MIRLIEDNAKSLRPRLKTDQEKGFARANYLYEALPTLIKKEIKFSSYI